MLIKIKRGGVITNVFMLLLLIIVVYKSQYYKKILQKLDLIEILPTDAPDYWALNGWTNTLQKIDYDADIAFFGNSITCMSDFQKSFPDKKVINLGYPGDTMKGMMLRMAMLRAVRPEKVFMMAGINGLKAMGVDQFAAEYETLVDSIQISLPHSQLYLQSILPVNANAYNRCGNNHKIQSANNIISQIAVKKGCIYVDLFSLFYKDGMLPQELTLDGVHLYPNAYHRWGNAIRKYVYEP
jgi:lysophospholipase L1-like esterase